jgi:uncharacterized RDD family membrane protein YckC
MSAAPLSIHGGNLAKEAVAALTPEGVLLAPLWKRAVAFTLDVLLISILINLLTGGKYYSVLMNWQNLASKYAAIWLLHLFLHMVIYWLYFKYTGRRLHRSLGQRAMRLAVVHDDATLLNDAHWNKRAISKLRYVIPGFGQIIGLIEFTRALLSGDHLTPLDKSSHTIVVIDYTLPGESRFDLG